MTEQDLIQGFVYRNLKNKQAYELIGIGKHSETLEDVVVYQALYDEEGIWVRPLDLFLVKFEMWDKA
jgi:hypothetical protein